MTMIVRAEPDAEPTIALTPSEIMILDHLVPDTCNQGAGSNTLQFYITKLARLAGYLARNSDPPPGNTVLWRGWRRLIDIQIGSDLHQGRNLWVIASFSGGLRKDGPRRKDMLLQAALNIVWYWLCHYGPWLHHVNRFAQVDMQILQILIDTNHLRRLTDLSTIAYPLSER